MQNCLDLSNYRQNAIYIPSKDLYIVSRHRHDFMKYEHDDGRYLFIDGGDCYFRAGGHFDLLKEGIVQNYCIDAKSTTEEVLNKACWGSYGKDGKGELRHRPIRTLTRAHLRAIKRDCITYISKESLQIVKYWLKEKYRE